MSKTFFKLASVLVIASFILFACNNTNRTSKDALAAHIDSTVKPGTDFFMYANGKWFKANPIPASEPSNGIWQLVLDTIKAQVKHICLTSAAIKNPEKGSNKQKIGDFYSAAMDSIMLNKNGISELKPELDKIDAIKDIKGMVKEAAYIHTISASPLFGFYVGQDDRLSSKYAVQISQGGLSLPDRSFYFDTDARAIMVRDKFMTHLANMFKIMGYDDAKAKLAADKLMKLETAIAKTSRKREDTRDPLKNYNKLTFKRLSEITPDLDWNIFVENVGLKSDNLNSNNLKSNNLNSNSLKSNNIKSIDSVIVGQPEFLKALNGYLKSFPLADWKLYLKFHLLNGLATFMDDKTYLEHFDFYVKTLRGVKEPKPRWKRVVEQTDASLGELIGQVYVSDYLPKGTKEKLLEIGNAIKSIYAERIKKLDWMSEPTKEKALKKLNSIVMKLGYPDKWKDLNAMQIDCASYLHNMINVNKWMFNYMTSKYGKPVDRTEWDMEPQTYNAYYNSSNNEIVIPGCNIIIPGYEGKLADDALLYSIIGATFGHEMTHGFDDQGCKYDENGNLHNWWTPADSAKFYAKTKMIVNQFNNYIAVYDLHINGELTQGENIADLGGIIMAYEAFQKTPQYKDNNMIAGLTPDQRFFLGYALGWMVNERPEAIANQVKSNEHSPAKFRVNGPLSNMPEFYKAFGIRQDDAMYRPESTRVQIW